MAGYSKECLISSKMNVGTMLGRATLLYTCMGDSSASEKQ